MAISALESLGYLEILAHKLDAWFSSRDIVATLIGVMSAVIDNVPLVAATIGMYDIPMDDKMWHFIAFSAGTGGSMLIIGSAAEMCIRDSSSTVKLVSIGKVSFIMYRDRVINSWIISCSFGFDDIINAAIVPNSCELVFTNIIKNDIFVFFGLTGPETRSHW